MKIKLLVFLSTCVLPSYFLHAFGQYPSQNVTLLSHWDTAATPDPYYAIEFNSVWGWVDPADSREYAIIGSTDGTYIIDVTTPSVPVMRDYVAGRCPLIGWREYKTYQNFLYAVSDVGSPNSLQIIDLSYLPDSVHVAYDDDSKVVTAHTIFIDGDKMYLNSVDGPATGGHSNMAVFSLANPVNPVLLRMIEQDYPSSDNVHDAFVRNDTCYASSSNSGMFIYKYNANNTFSLIGSISNYAPGSIYNHSSALTADGKTLIFADEVPPGLPLKSLDVSNMGNLTIVDTFRSAPTSGATAHNPFIRPWDNSRLVVGYYQDGIQIFDISNPANISRTGYFDCAPTNCPSCPTPDYSGCWGVYIDLPSGIILASDMQDGLFVLDATAAGMGVQTVVSENSADVFPNPFTTHSQIDFSLVAAEKINYDLTDITGKTILKNQLNAPAGKSSLTIDGKTLSAGAYLLSVKSETISFTKKLIKNK